MASDEASRGASPQPPAQRPNQPPPPAPTPSPTPSPTPPAYDNPAFAGDEPDRVESNGGAHLAEEKNGSPAKLNGNHRRDISGLDRTPQQKKDPAEAVNLELVNLPAARHQNGSSVPALPNEATDTRLPHKKDAHNETSNYDEYFVPVNEHKKYMRGEKLYVTAEKGRSGASAGGRKKACWIAGLLALAVAVVIAVLAGTGVIFSNDATALRNDTFSASAARSFGSQAAPNHPNHIEAPSDEALLYVPKAVEGVFVIDNAQFVDELSSSDSRAFKSFAPALEEAILNALFDSQTRNYGANDLHVKIVNFTSGSIVVRYRVSWSPKNGIKANDPITMETLNIKLQSYLEKNSNQLSKYQIRSEGMKSERIIDLCKFNNNGCENGCEFNRNQLRFVCICPDSKVPDRSNPKKCVEPQYIDLGSSDMPDYLDVSKVIPISSANPKPVPEGEPEPGILTTTESGWAEPKFFSTAPSSKPEPNAEQTTESGWAEPKFLSAEPSSEPEPKAEPATESGWAEPKFLSSEPSSEPEPKAEPTTEPGWAEPKFLSVEPSSEPEPKAEPTTEPGWAEPKFLSAEPSSEPEPKAEPTTESGWAEPKFLSSEPSSEPEPKAEPTTEPGWAEPKFLSAEPSSEPEPKAEPTTESGWAEPKFLSSEPSSEPEPKAEPTTEPGWAEPKFLSVEPSSEPEPKAEPTTEPGWAEPKFLSAEPSSEPEPKAEPTNEPGWAEPKFLSTEASSEPEPKAEPGWAEPKFLSTEPSSEPEPKAEQATEPGWAEPKFLSTEASSEPEPKAEPGWVEPKFLSTEASSEVEPKTEPGWAEPKFLSTEPSSEPEPKAEQATEPGWAEPKFLSTEASSKPEPKAEPGWVEPKFLSTEASSEVEPKAEPKAEQTTESGWDEPKFLSAKPSSEPEPKEEPTTESGWAEPKFLSTEPSSELEPNGDPKAEQTTESGWAEPKFLSTEPSSKPEIKIERESSQDGSNFEGRSLSVITLEPEIETTHQIEIEHPVTKESNLSKDAISEGSKPSSDESLWIEPNIYKSSNNNSERLNLKPNNATANESVLIEPTSLDDEWLDPSFISDSTNSLWTEPKMFSFSSNDSSMTNDFTNFTKSVPNIFISSVQNSTVNSISSVKKSDFFEPKFITSSESSAINLSSSKNSSEREPSWSEPEFMFTTTDGSSIVQKIPSLSTAPVVDLVSSTVASTETMWSNPKFMESSGENISSTETMWLEPKYTNLPIHVSSNSSSSDDMWSEPQSNSLSENITNVVNSQDTAKTDSNVMMILDVKAKAFKHNNANVAVVSVGNETSISVSSNDESASEENNTSENNLEKSERNISAAWAIPKYIYDLQNASKHQDESSTLSGSLHSNPAPVWEEPEIEAEHVYTYKNLDDEDAVTLSSTSLTSKTTSNEISHTSESNYLLFGSTHAHDDANTTANDDGWMEPQIPLSTNKGLKPHIYEVTTQPNEDRASVSYHFVHSNATTEMSPFLPDLEGHGDILHERHELETSGEHEYKKIEEPLNVQPLLTDSSSSKSHYDDDLIASSTEGVSETAVLNETKSGLSVKMTENESLAVSNKSSDKESLWEEPSYNNSLSNDYDWQSASTTSQHDEESLSVLPLSKPSKKYEYSKKYDKHQKSDDSSELNDIFNGKNRNNR